MRLYECGIQAPLPSCKQDTFASEGQRQYWIPEQAHNRVRNDKKMQNPLAPFEKWGVRQNTRTQTGLNPVSTYAEFKIYPEHTIVWRPLYQFSVAKAKITNLNYETKLKIT
ncbi:MAG: hypothetical protein NTW25_06590 [Candidatus Kapabacteria bacterium]|nr:hypothetical protein [Candidatus Kapabacteria bacterium]